MGSKDLERMRHLADVIDGMCEIGGDLPTRMLETRRRLALRIAKFENVLKLVFL